MTFDTRLERLAVTVALALPCVTSIVLMILAPGNAAPVTYVVVVALLLGSATVALNAWTAAHATGGIGQLIYETNTVGASEAGITRWTRGTGTDDRSTSQVRVAAMLMLSAGTTAIIVATWLS
jgi:hypothetical protein